MLAAKSAECEMLSAAKNQLIDERAAMLEHTANVAQRKSEEEAGHEHKLVEQLKEQVVEQVSEWSTECTLPVPP
jgi:hypothetical protein